MGAEDLLNRINGVGYTPAKVEYEHVEIYYAAPNEEYLAPAGAQFPMPKDRVLREWK